MQRHLSQVTMKKVVVLSSLLVCERTTENILYPLGKTLNNYICCLSFLVAVFRYLTEKVVPGNRVTVMGIYSIKKVAQKADKVSFPKVCNSLE